MNKNYEVVPENTIILGENQYYSKDCYDTQLNNNVLVVGTSGSGKTRKIVRPNLLQASGSYVVSDPKGNLVKTMGPYLKSKGYEVLTIDFSNPGESARYNPIELCRSTTDVLKLAHSLVYDTSHQGGARDPFWDETTMILLSAVIGYMMETDELADDEKNMFTLVNLIKEAKRHTRRTFETGPESPLEERMMKHKAKMMQNGQYSWAVSRYEEFGTTPDKTYGTIIICALAKLAAFDSVEIRRMLSGNDLFFNKIGEKPTALFVVVSDTDRSMDVLVNLFYTQLMNELCSYADNKCDNSCLPVPVQFILDDFATNARIDNFQNMIANIRSRGISAMIMVQSESQLYASYGVDAQTIIDNCNTYVYMGGSDPTLAENIARRADKPAIKILNMPLSMSWIFRRGETPVLCNNFDLEWFEKEKGFKSGKPVNLIHQNEIEHSVA